MAQVAASCLADKLLYADPAELTIFVRLTAANLFAFAADGQQRLMQPHSLQQSAVSQTLGDS